MYNPAELVEIRSVLLFGLGILLWSIMTRAICWDPQPSLPLQRRASSLWLAPCYARSHLGPQDLQNSADRHLAAREQ